MSGISILTNLFTTRSAADLKSDELGTSTSGNSSMAAKTFQQVAFFHNNLKMADDL